MGEFEIILPHYIERKTIIKIKCRCGRVQEVRLEAIYRQKLRGNVQYRCKYCAGKAGWTDKKKQTAQEQSKKHWDNPTYAGTIVGKAIAAEIRRKS